MSSFVSGLIARIKDRSFPKATAFMAAVVLSSGASRRLRSGTFAFLKLADRSVDSFASEAQKTDPGKRKRLMRAILYDYFVYRISFPEYFLFNFADLTDAEKRSFIGDRERAAVFSRIGIDASISVITDKVKAYQRLKDFYKRDAVPVREASDLEGFLVFTQKHDNAILKKVDGSLGEGVQIVDLRALTFDAEKFFRGLLAKGPHIVEELIRQAPEMAIFHPASVNTVRYETWCENEKVTPMISFIRMGRGGSVVDNAGAGGVFASVDVNSGIVKTDGVTEYGQRFEIHPDSGVAIKGFQVPRWEELKAVAEQAAKSVPEQPCVAWDFALSDVGWVIVEGNTRGQFVQQICEQKGCRREIEAIIGKDKFRF